MALRRRVVGLAVGLGGAGVLHLVRPRVYERLVPPELGDARANRQERTAPASTVAPEVLGCWTERG